MTHFFSQKVCRNDEIPMKSEGRGPGNHENHQSDTLSFTKSVSILMEFNGNHGNTYSNSYKKLMILRESTRIDQTRGGND